MLELLEKVAETGSGYVLTYVGQGDEFRAVVVQFLDGRFEYFLRKPAEVHEIGYRGQVTRTGMEAFLKSWVPVAA